MEYFGLIVFIYVLIDMLKQKQWEEKFVLYT